MDEFLKSHPMVSWMLAGVAFLVAFVLILKIIEIAVDLRRRMPKGQRGRQLRLGFVETFDLDGERQLMLVRRDNIEHLVLIGGPNDVLIESGIVRVEPRETRTPRAAEAQSGASAPVMAPLAAATPAPAPAPAPAPFARSPEPAPLPEPMPDKAETSIFARQSPPVFAPAPVPALAEESPDDFVSPPLIAAIEAALAAPPAPPADEAELTAALKQATEQQTREGDVFAEPRTGEKPPEPPAVAPVPERVAPRFPLPPRPASAIPPKPFGSASPPRFPSPPIAPGAPKADEPQRPRFVMPPVARRANPPLSGPSAPLPPSVEPASPPPAPETVLPPAAPKASFGAFSSRPAAPPPPPAPPVAPPAPPLPEAAAESDFEPMETLEEEMAKLLGRPINK